MNEIYILVLPIIVVKTEVEMTKALPRIISTVTAVAILALLLILGPAEAFILDLMLSEKSPTIGDLITFTASAEVEEGEIIPIEYFILKLEGAELASCKFDVNGTIIEDCKGLIITRLSAPEFGFGFGYGYGFKPGRFIFEIIMDTSLYSIGKYETKLIAVSSGSEIEILGDKFFINAAMKGACSVRADDGNLEIGESEFNNNRLSFIVPLKKASTGQGFLISQEKRERFFYKFNVVNIIENNDKILSVLTSGKYRIGQKKGTISNAVITVNKKTKEVTINDGAFEANNMKISFIKGC